MLGCYSVSVGGGYIESLILIIFSIIFSYCITTFYFTMKKSKYLYSNATNYLLLNIINQGFNIDLKNILSKVFKSIDYKLYKKDYLSFLNLKRYILIKYFFSIYLFFISMLFFKKVILSLLILIFIFFIPDFLLYFLEKLENIKLKKDISNIVQIMIFLLMSDIPIKKLVPMLEQYIKVKRFKKCYRKFLKIYSNLNDSKNYSDYLNILNKFSSNYVRSFFEIISNTTKKSELIIQLKTLNFLIGKKDICN